jgi:hypothetical protein
VFVTAALVATIKALPSPKAVYIWRVLLLLLGGTHVGEHPHFVLIYHGE